MPLTRYDFLLNIKCFNSHYFSLAALFPLLGKDLPGRGIDPQKGGFPKQSPCFSIQLLSQLPKSKAYL